MAGKFIDMTMPDDASVRLSSCRSEGRALTQDAAGEAPKCPIILRFRRRDSGIPIRDVEALIAAGHPRLQVLVYAPGHGFNCDRRADFEPESARLARERTLELFRANGG